MKIRNSTDWSDRFLRRVVAWCCGQIGLPVRKVNEAQFRNKTRDYSGHAYWSGRIVCSVGRDTYPVERRLYTLGGRHLTRDEIMALSPDVRRELHFRSGRVGDLETSIVTEHHPNYPIRPDSRDGMANEVIADRLECLVAITAHELEHIRQYRTGASRLLKAQRRSEPATRAVEVRVLRAFRANRDALLAEWSSASERVEKPKATVQEQRASKAQSDLARWQRKLKLAQTKVRKLKTRVRYYDNLQTAASKPQSP